MGMRRQARETISCREFQVSPSCWVLIHLLPALMELPSSLWISIYALCIFHPLLKATVCVSLVDLSSLNESSCEFSWSFIGGGRTGGWWSRNQGSNASAREWERGQRSEGGKELAAGAAGRGTCMLPPQLAGLASSLTRLSPVHRGVSWFFWTILWWICWLVSWLLGCFFFWVDIGAFLGTGEMVAPAYALC